MAPAAAPPPATSSRVSAEPPQLGLNLLPHGAGESTKALRLVGLDPTLANAVDGGSALPTARPSSRRNDSWTTGKRPSADALADALLDWSPASSTAGSSSGDLLLQQRPARTSSSSAAAINGPSRANARGDNREGKLTALLGLSVVPPHDDALTEAYAYADRPLPSRLRQAGITLDLARPVAHVVAQVFDDSPRAIKLGQSRRQPPVGRPGWPAVTASAAAPVVGVSIVFCSWLACSAQTPQPADVALDWWAQPWLWLA
jgi:hypothetical protein